LLLGLLNDHLFGRAAWRWEVMEVFIYSRPMQENDVLREAVSAGPT
jgi:hypothetical protein